MSKIVPYENTDKLTIKQRMWLKSYLNCFNMTQAARDAGYKDTSEDSLTSIGHQNFRKLHKVINEWIDNVGLSDERIKTKISQGLEAKETKFFTDKGIVTDEREVDALNIQAKYTDMAAKVKGIYTTGPGESEDKPLHIKVLDRFDALKEGKDTPQDASGSTKKR